MTRFDVFSLRAGIAIPFLYFGSVAAGALFYPGFSLVRQFASELGADGAPHPLILNVGIVMVGIATLIATFGFWRTLTHLSAKPVPARLTCYILAGFGVAMVMAGLFPIPNYLMHSGFGLSLPILVGPALLAIALGNQAGAKPLRVYLIVTNILMAAMLVLYLGATHSKIVGLCQLLYTVTAIPWMGVGAYALSSYVEKRSPEQSATVA